MDKEQNTVQKSQQDFDLRPNPRVLPMLGEINLEQWRCVGELIDNSLDGFLHQIRSGTEVSDPEVHVDIPSADVDGAILRIRDNGPGMTPDVLQNAVSAGWSGNNPIDNLGLFGMGFNIATARLGSVTEVWTTQKGDSEWHGLEISFEKLKQQRHFKTPHLTRPKPDTEQHGTEVTIKELKPQQRAWFAKSSNINQLRKRLSQTYATMLRDNGVPLSFNLFVNNIKVISRNHCVWNEERVVVLPDLGEVPAVINFDYTLTDRNYCTNCMNWLAAGTDKDEPCPICSSDQSVTSRRRKIRGWIGLQRYLDKTEFGFDLIRNGRKIEIFNKDLFSWVDDEGEQPEYPIDDQRGRGRFVGEIHMDHCRVSYAKDRFDRTDPAWEEVVRLIRGEGPLLPKKAKDLGFQGNSSPLFRLFKAFRRTSPQSKVAGAWARILLVKDNNRAVEMSRQFYEGHPDFQDDSNWWDLVGEADGELLHGPSSPGSTNSDDEGGDPVGDVVGDIIGGADEDPDTEETEDTPAKTYERTPIPSLTRRYADNSTGMQWRVEAFFVEADDPELADKKAWILKIEDSATRTYHFLVDRNNPCFSSLTLTPRDALLMELSIMIADYTREFADPPSFSEVLVELKSKYAEEDTLDPRLLQPDAIEILGLIARAFVANIPEEELASLFNDLSVEDQQKVMGRLAARRVKPNSVIRDGTFLEYLPYEFVPKFISHYPQHFFDGAIWDEPYQTLDYAHPQITSVARAAIIRRYQSLIDDVGWLATRESSDLDSVPKEELIRAMMSVRLLRPDSEIIE